MFIHCSSCLIVCKVLDRLLVVANLSGYGYVLAMIFWADQSLWRITFNIVMYFRGGVIARSFTCSAGGSLGDRMFQWYWDFHIIKGVLRDSREVRGSPFLSLRLFLGPHVSNTGSNIDLQSMLYNNACRSLPWVRTVWASNFSAGCDMMGWAQIALAYNLFVVLCLGAQCD